MEEDLSYAKASIGLHPNTTEDKLVKVLGLPWDINSDEFVLSLSALASFARALTTTKIWLQKYSSLTYDELNTILIEVEALIKSRPITYIYDDIESISYPLCPSHLIYGRRITSMPSSEHYEIVLIIH